MARHACMIVVREPSEAAVAGVRVAVEEASEPVPEIAYVTDSAGMVQMGLPPGRVALRLFFPSGVSRRVTLDIRDVPGKRYELGSK